MSEPVVTPPPPSPNPIARLDGASKLVALLGTAFLSLSVFYDFSFLSAIGLTFGDVPTTISDHVRSAIVWAPSIIVFGGMGAAWGAWESADRRPGSVGKTRNWLERNQGRAIMVLAVATIAMQFGGAAWFYFAFVGLWLEFFGPPVARKWVVSSSATTNWLVVGIVPALFAAIGGYGYVEGDLLLRASDPRWEVTFKSEKGTETKRYLGLRRFSSASVLVDTERRVSVVQSDLIQQVSSLRDGTHESLVCRWLGQNCLAPPQQQRVSQAPAPVAPASAGKPASGSK